MQWHLQASGRVYGVAGLSLVGRHAVQQLFWRLSLVTLKSADTEPRFIAGRRRVLVPTVNNSFIAAVKPAELFIYILRNYPSMKNLRSLLCACNISGRYLCSFVGIPSYQCRIDCICRSNKIPTVDGSVAHICYLIVSHEMIPFQFTQIYILTGMGVKIW